MARRPSRAEPVNTRPRLGAKVVDGVPFLVAGSVANYFVLGDPGADQQAGSGAGAAVSALVVLALYLYLVVSESRSGTTLGKRVLGLRVQDELGQPPSLVAAAKRNVWLLPSVLPLPFMQVVTVVASVSVVLTVSRDPRHEGWHDRLADVTTVVRVDRR